MSSIGLHPAVNIIKVIKNNELDYILTIDVLLLCAHFHMSYFF